MSPQIVIFGVMLVMALSIGGVVWTQMAVVLEPNEVAIVSGSAAGGHAGCRIVRDSPSLSFPVLTVVDRLDLSPLSLEFQSSEVFSKDLVPVDFDVSAEVAIGESDQLLRRAAERFLGSDRDEIRAAARAVVEGELYAVVGDHGAEMLAGSGREEVENAATARAAETLERLGLELRRLRIESVDRPTD